MTIEYKGSDSITPFHVRSMHLKGASGWLYEGEINAMLLAGTLDTEVLPGETIHWQAGFRVPEDASGLSFIFDEDPSTPGRVTVAWP
jgi:hypothetical protein